jgi:hypothetical protein
MPRRPSARFTDFDEFDAGSAEWRLRSALPGVLLAAGTSGHSVRSRIGNIAPHAWTVLHHQAIYLNHRCTRVINCSHLDPPCSHPATACRFLRHAQAHGTTLNGADYLMPQAIDTNRASIVCAGPFPRFQKAAAKARQCGHGASTSASSLEVSGTEEGTFRAHEHIPNQSHEASGTRIGLGDSTQTSGDNLPEATCAGNGPQMIGSWTAERMKLA